MIPTSFLAALLLLQAPAHESAPAPVPIVLKAARLFRRQVRRPAAERDGDRRGQVHQGGRPGLAVPEGSKVIDLGDATLCPGFIDAHTHLTHERTADYNQGFVDGMRREVAEQAILSTVYARRTIEAGFTTVRDVGSDDFLDVGLRNSIAKGVVPGPRMLVCVHALGPDRRPFRPNPACAMISSRSA